VTGKNATPMIGWHPRADHVAWLESEVKRRGITRTALLDEILDYYREQTEKEEKA
jgi:hypothetical protein